MFVQCSPLHGHLCTVEPLSNPTKLWMVRGSLQFANLQLFIEMFHKLSDEFLP